MRAASRLGFVLIVAAPVALPGCYSFSSYQSARLVPAGAVELTPSVSRFQLTWETAKLRDGDWTLDAQVRTGVARYADVGVRLSRIFLEDGYEFIALDPKLALVPDRVAIALPMGTFFGQELDTHLQLHPTLYFSAPVSDSGAEATFAAKALILYDEAERDRRTLWGMTAGIRFHGGDERWALQPEVGILVDDDEDRTSFVQFGLGVAVRLDRLFARE